MVRVESTNTRTAGIDTNYSTMITLLLELKHVDKEQHTFLKKKKEEEEQHKFRTTAQEHWWIWSECTRHVQVNS